MYHTLCSIPETDTILYLKDASLKKNSKKISKQTNRCFFILSLLGLEFQL